MQPLIYQVTGCVPVTLTLALTTTLWQLKHTKEETGTRSSIVLENSLKVLVGLLVVSMISSCAPAVRVFVYNHTQNRIWIAEQTNSEAVETDTLREIKLSDDKHVQLWIEEEKLDYLLPTIPMEYRQSTFMGFSDVHLQVEAAGELYVISPMDQLPAQNLGHQPKGFPVKPSRQRQLISLFAAWEQPELFSAELRAGFRSLRK
jgi:hypothetical protein